jgi:hypothetical protein
MWAGCATGSRSLYAKLAEPDAENTELEMRAEERLPDDVNEGDINGVRVRKGTVGAFIANAKVLSDPVATAQARAVAERDLIDALPALRALGLFEVLSIRDDKLRALVEAHLATLQGP